MVCLSVAMLTKQGKILLARQFVEMTRMKVENHLATFPKLIGTERQHNTVETSEVRYVYQPIETLILVLITNKHSNIVEDLETLRLFAKAVPEYCPGEVDEASICKNAFELLFAFDEIIACGCGYRENVSMREVQVALEMESHEEKLAKMIRQSKEREAQQEMVRKAKQISRENRSKGVGSGGGMGSMRDFADDLRSGAAQVQASMEAAGAMPGVGPSSTPNSFGGSGSYGGHPPKKGTGMQLGSAKKGPAGASLLQAMAAEAESEVNAVGGAGRGPAAAAALAGGVGGGGVSLVAEEKLAISMSRDGGLQSFEVKGEMQLLVSDAAHGKALVPLVLGANSGYQFKTHPNINKPAFHNESELGLRDRSRPFPVGSTVGVLKWRMVSMDEAIVPLIINCWPTQTGGDAWEVTVEYELGAAYVSKLELRNMTVSIPAPVESLTQVVASHGTASFSKRDGALTWHVPIIDATAASGTVEFALSGMPSADALFPIHCAFTGAATLCEVDVAEVRSADGHGPLPFSYTPSLTVETYVIA